MSLMIVLGIILALLFALMFFTRRRFGILGLALVAGSVMNGFWGVELTAVLQGTGIQLISPPLSTVVAAVLVLTPAILLLLKVPVYHRMLDRAIGSAVFAVLTLALLLPALGSALTLYGDSLRLYLLIADYREWIITGGVLYAVFDLFWNKVGKHKEK